jgi:hypothetical protein
MTKTNQTYDRMKEEITNLKQQITWLDDSFLLESDVDAKKIYGYLKNKPSASEFVYQKYQNLRPVITEVCDPKNPLYLPKVREALKDVIDLQSRKEDIRALEEKFRYLRSESDSPQSELDQKKSEYDLLEQRIMEIEHRAEEIDRQMGNLTDPEILSMVKEFYSEFIALSQSVLDVKDPGRISEVILQVRSLSRDQVQSLKLLSEKAVNNLQVISNEDMISEIKLSEKREKLKDEIQTERKNAENELNAFMSHNPKRLIPKAIENISLSIRHFQRGDVDMSGLKWFNAGGQSQVLSPLNEALELLNHLQDQVENRKRREK